MGQGWRSRNEKFHILMTNKTCRFIYVYGGFDGVNFIQSVERYDPYLKVWERMNNMPSAKAYFASTVL